MNKIKTIIVFFVCVFCTNSLWSQFQEFKWKSIDEMTDYNERHDFVDRDKVLESDRIELLNLSTLKSGRVTSNAKYFKVQFYDVLDANAPNNTTLTHEIGHIFGLAHTFSDDPTKLELVTRGTSANCSYRADKFCDTAADPKVEKWEIDSISCVHTGTRRDSLNVPYNPPIQNFMTYGYPHCRTEFSPSQISKISLTSNVTRLQNRLSPITSVVGNSNLNYNVSGELVRLQNVTVNSGANISINACGWVKLEGDIEFKVGAVVVIND